MGKELMAQLAGFAIEMVSSLLDRVEPEAEKAGMEPKEWFAENDGEEIWASVQDIAEDLNQIPEDFPGRLKLFEMYEEVIEKVERYRS